MPGYGNNFSSYGGEGQEDPADSNVLRNALLAGLGGFGAGVLHDKYKRSPLAPPGESYRMPGLLNSLAMGNPTAAPILRGLAYGIPLATLAAMVTEVVNSNRRDEAIPWEKQFTALPEDDKAAFAEGLVKECEAKGIDAEDMVKQAGLVMGTLAAMALLSSIYGVGKHGYGAVKSFGKGDNKEALKHLGWGGLDALMGGFMVGPAGKAITMTGKALMGGKHTAGVVNALAKQRQAASATKGLKSLWSKYWMYPFRQATRGAAATGAAAGKYIPGVPTVGEGIRSVGHTLQRASRTPFSRFSSSNWVWPATIPAQMIMPELKEDMQGTWRSQAQGRNSLAVPAYQGYQKYQGGSR